MNKSFILFIAISLTFGIVGNANAALWDRGGGLIYDDDLNITWLADANYAQTSGYDADGLMTWSDANTWAANLSFRGAADWRLPTADPTCGSMAVNCINSEMGHLFYTELSGTAYNSIVTSGDPDLNFFTNIRLNQMWYWTSTPGPYSGRYTFDFFYGYQAELRTYSEQPVWAVHDGDVGSPVPLPGAIWLLGSGLIGIVGIRRKFKK